MWADGERGILFCTTTLTVECVCVCGVWCVCGGGYDITCRLHSVLPVHMFKEIWGIQTTSHSPVIFTKRCALSSKWMREKKKKHISPDVSGRSTCRCLGKFCVLSSFPSGGEVGADNHDVMLENADTVVQKWKAVSSGVDYATRSRACFKRKGIFHSTALLFWSYCCRVTSK